MKATYFQKSLEYRLTIEGETWRQGDRVKGVLTVKNHGTTPVDTAQTRVVLAVGALKHVRAKDPDAFEAISQTSGSPGTLAPGSEWSFHWEFTTDRNCPITDTISSLFMLYGIPDSPDKLDPLGQIQLIVQPFNYADDIVQSLQTQHRFIRKSQKYRKGYVDFKLEPPDSKGFASLEQLIMSAKSVGDDIEIQYQFNIKKLEALPGRAEFVKKKLEYEQLFTRMDYLTTSGKFNHDVVEAKIQEALAQVTANSL